LSATDVTALAQEIQELAPAEQLRLAANLIELRRLGLANAIVQRVALELGAITALGLEGHAAVPEAR
jgi:hypothetical protein